MSTHGAFATMVVPTTDGWELWSAWRVGPAIHCHRARFAAQETAQEHQRIIVSRAVSLRNDRSALDAELNEVASKTTYPHPISRFHFVDIAWRYFAGGRVDPYLHMAAHHLVKQVGTPTRAIDPP
jgi:hypothetical protein